MSRTCYVALLRGINVGRAKRIAMADLRRVVESLGYSSVRTLLNSGNVVFCGRAGQTTRIAAAIERAVQGELGVASRVTVITAGTLREVIRRNPLAHAVAQPSRFLVGFLREGAQAEAQLASLAARSWGEDAIALGGGAAYLWCAGGILESELLTAVGRLLGDGVTTRNWTTVQKLGALAASVEESS